MQNHINDVVYRYLYLQILNLSLVFICLEEIIVINIMRSFFRFTDLI